MPISIMCSASFLYGYTVEPLYSGHHQGQVTVLITEVVLISWVTLYYKGQFGTFSCVLNTEVSSFQRAWDREAPLYSMLIHMELTAYIILRTKILHMNA